MSKTKAADELHPADEELVWAAPIARAEIRKETGIPTWEPKLLNGSHYFGQRMRALIRQRRKTSGY